MKYQQFPPPEVGRARTLESDRLHREAQAAAAAAAVVKTDPTLIAAKYWTPDKDNKSVECTGEQVQFEVNLDHDILICPQANTAAGWKKATEVGFFKVALEAIETIPVPTAPLAPTPDTNASPNNPAVVSTDPRRLELEKLPNPLLLKEAQDKGINPDPTWTREQMITAILAK